MIPARIIKESFKRPPTPSLSRKDAERLKLEEDMRQFLAAGGRVSQIERGKSHDLHGKGISDSNFTAIQEVDIW